MNEYKKLSRPARKAARTLELVVGFVLGLVTLPVYAVIALLVWMTAAREVIDGWSLIPVVLVYWIVDTLTTVAVLWAIEGQREARWVGVVAHTVGRLSGSVVAWWTLSDFTAAGAVAGLLTGLVWVVLWWIYDFFGERRRPTDPAERQAEDEAMMRALLFPTGKKETSGGSGDHD